ncbi:SPOR domain-containing protein [Sphingomonas sp. ID0503]|uniref:SPOR domain-containing protein n=1 Tax=Sphingomonas sp. ID0503 TaxID=3399691 RepID=UPI003AFB1526
MGDRRAASRDYDESLPWLEPVEAENARPRRKKSGGGGGRFLLIAMILLLVAFVGIGLAYWAIGEGEGDGPPGLIKAQPGPYKVPTDKVGGMEVAGQGDSTYATSQGDDRPSQIDLSALPEAPMTTREAEPAAVSPKPTASTAAAPKSAAPAPAPVKAAPPTPKPAPAKVEPPKPETPLSGGTIQLGAFSSEAKANAAWKALSKRFAALGGLTPAIAPVSTANGTLYRLRAAAGGQAGSICAKMKVSGDSCSVVGN